MRKEQIINMALTIAAENGLLAITLTEVARRIGCCHGTVSYHFGTIEALREETKNVAIARKDKKVLPWLRAMGMAV